MKKPTQKYRLLFFGIGLGIAYGLITRLVFGEKATLASATFLFVIPTILGIIPLLFADDTHRRSYRNIIFIPWLTIISFFFILFLFGIEDFICLIVLAAPFIILGTVGALIFTIFKFNKQKRKNKLPIIAIIPFILAPLEQLIVNPPKTYHITSEIYISASPETIWENIVEVKPITTNEYNTGFFNSIGIPRPLSAAVDKKEKGGIRIGNFEDGLKFIEIITEYQENKKVSFNIKIDSNTVSDKVFDQHVLKGNYFSFVDATYELKELQNGSVLLLLTSSYRLTSTINFYGKFWGDLILKDFQNRLLEVIAYRCESN